MDSILLSRAPLAFGLAALAFSSPNPRDGELRFAPEKDSVVERAYSSATEWRLDTLTQVAAGAVVSEEVPPMEGTVLREIETTDRYGEVRGGAPLGLHRSYTEIEASAECVANMGGGDQIWTVGLDSELAGRGLVWARDDVDADATVRFEEDEEPKESPLFEGLREDFDLRAILPPEDEGVGDTWRVGEEVLLSILAPGGRVAWEVDADPEGAWGDLGPTDLVAMALLAPGELDDDVEGKATVEWEATEDGKATLLIDLDLVLRAELGDRLDRVRKTSAVTDEREELSLLVEWTTEGEGVIIWDLGAGRVESMTLELEDEVEVEMSWTQSMGGQEVEVSGIYGLVGETKIEMTVDAE